MINKKKILNLKFGVSLLVLSLTIIVLLILITTTVFSIKSAIDTASLTMFAENLNKIQDAVEDYYIQNNIIPSVDNSIVMSSSDLLAIARLQDKLLEELTENNDLNSQFYAIDLVKLNITKTQYGNKKLGDNDIFVISYPSMNVYYPHGIDSKNETYFSLTSKISKVIKIDQNQAYTSRTSVSLSGGINVTQFVGWSNKMGVSIDVDMSSDELLYMSVSGDPNRLITTNMGKNAFSFNLLSSIVNNAETIKIPTLTIEEVNYIESGTKPLAERYVDIFKYKNSEIIGDVRIDLSNFSTNAPTIINSITSSTLSQNTVKISLGNSESGIKEVKYGYLTKYTNNGNIDKYYVNVSDFDNTYMLNKAKNVKLEKDLTSTISVPKNVQSIKIAIIDKAGNISLYNQEIAPRLYIGYSLDSFTSETLQITARMYSRNGIKSISFSKSTDGINFSNEQVYILNTTTNGTTTKQSLPYTKIAESSVYIKMVAVNYDNTIIETRIVRVDLVKIFGVGLDVIANANITFNGLPAAYNNPIVPEGFKAINDGAIWPTDWNKGLVIEDIEGNQFVWVPVDGTNVPYAKWCNTGILFNHVDISDDTLPIGVTSETEQILKYGGFYIARFEAGKENIDKIVSKKLVTVWKNINYTDAKINAESMYDTSLLKSGLVTGSQWDTVMKWLQNSGKDVSTDSRTWGNYSNSRAPANVTGFGSLKTSGYSEFWKANNIYDMAGNSWEWTNEIYKNNRLTRGGSYNVNGNNKSCDFRNQESKTFKNNQTVFRCVLYVK
jgi:hypothetical protein